MCYITCPYPSTSILCPFLPCSASQEAKLYYSVSEVLSASVLTAVTNYHTLGALHNTCISYSSGSWKSKIKVPAWSVAGENFLWGCSWLLSYWIHTWWKERESLWNPIYKGYKYSGGLRPHDLIIPQMYHLVLSSHGGLGFQHINFRRTQILRS